MKCLGGRPRSAHGRGALWILLVAPLALALLWPSLLAAQGGAGSIHGTVLDPSGGAVANAGVQVTPAAGGTALMSTTNAILGWSVSMYVKF